MRGLLIISAIVGVLAVSGITWGQSRPYVGPSTPNPYLSPSHPGYEKFYTGGDTRVRGRYKVRERYRGRGYHYAPYRPYGGAWAGQYEYEVRESEDAYEKLRPWTQNPVPNPEPNNPSNEPQGSGSEQ